MSSIWNNNISISIFGESQGPAIGVVIDNLPPGEYIDVQELSRFMARRDPRSDGTTARRSEKDMPQIMSGVLNEKTTGTPLCAFIQNTDIRPPEDPTERSGLIRPGHADYTGTVRYRGFNDVRDEGHSSGRLTAPLVFAGAICAQILERRGIYAGAHIAEIHGIKDDEFDRVKVSKEDLLKIRYKKFPVINDEKGKLMAEDIQKASDGGESLGGIVECACINVPAGIGSPIFDGLENSLAQLIFGIPGVQGLEFGAGFKSAKMVGSQSNDEFYIDDRGYVKTKTNNHGGILGGISSGMPITLRAAIRPSPSINKPQETVDTKNMKKEVIVSGEKHDPCIVPRSVPCVEAAVNIAVLSHMLNYPHFY